MKDFIIYVTFVLISIIAMFSGAWLNGGLQPIISLDWVQQGLVNTASYLFAYVIALWLSMFFIVIFRKKLNNFSGVNENHGISIASTVISIIALVAIPLTLIVWQSVRVI